MINLIKSIVIPALVCLVVYMGIYILTEKQDFTPPGLPTTTPPVFIHETDTTAHYLTGEIDLVYGYVRDGMHIVEIIRENEPVFVVEFKSHDEAKDYMDRLIEFERRER